MAKIFRHMYSVLTAIVLLGCGVKEAYDTSNEILTKFDSINRQLEATTPGSGSFSQRADSVKFKTERLLQEIDMLKKTIIEQENERSK